MTTPLKTFNLSETALFSDRTRKKKKKSKLNNTFAIDRLRDDGFSFLNMYYSHKNDGNAFKKVTNETNTSIVLDASSKRNLNETVVLKSNRSSENISKKKVYLQLKIRRGIKRMKTSALKLKPR